MFKEFLWQREADTPILTMSLKVSDQKALELSLQTAKKTLLPQKWGSNSRPSVFRANALPTGGYWSSTAGLAQV